MELLPVKKYFGNVIFNSYKLEREFEWVELNATDCLSQTFDQGDYGRKSIGFAFRLFVEPEVNFGRYNECIYSMGKTKIFHIACHLDYAYFTSISQPEQLKVTLNAASVLLIYCRARFALPKEFLLNKLIADYQQYLEEHALLLPAQVNHQIIIKPLEAVGFNFVQTTACEEDPESLGHPLLALSGYISHHLARESFGESVRQFSIGYELFAFSGPTARYHQSTKSYRSYRPKYKELLIVRQFDTQTLKDLPEKEQFTMLKNAILSAVDEVELLKTRPKRFDRGRFKERLAAVLLQYEFEKMKANA